MLEKNPDYRITAEEALKHPYFDGLDPVSSKNILTEDEVIQDDE